MAREDLGGGIVLPPLKAKIFKMVRRAGHAGVTIERINYFLFDDESTRVNIRMHMSQINRMLVGTPFRVLGDGKMMRGCYRLKNFSKKT